MHNNLGLLYDERGQRDDAVKQFQRAIAINPTYVKAHNNLGVSLMRANQLTAAASEFRVALAADPRSAGSHYTLAVVADEGGDAATAIEHYRAFLRFGTVTHADLVGRVRARLTTLGG